MEWNGAAVTEVSNMLKTLCNFVAFFDLINMPHEGPLGRCL